MRNRHFSSRYDYIQHIFMYVEIYTYIDTGRFAYMRNRHILLALGMTIYNTYICMYVDTGRFAYLRNRHFSVRFSPRH
jgi:hypothetical protein